MKAFLARTRKAQAALAAGLGVMVAAGLITGSVAAWATGLVSAAGAFLAVYAAPKNGS